MPKIRFLKEAKDVEVPSGANLRDSGLTHGVAMHRGINKYLNCLGHGTCGTCRVLVKNDTMKHCSPKGLWEKLRLALSWFAIGVESEIRLSCQTKVLGDVDVETTPELNLFGKPLKGV
ncbi:MAG: (2Fe-2S)-binding protein [Candidatus Omnitrophica bacterium]|nr:(2Fe-2S)-binding protein [Candidatus Omnitrophota bacterium]